MDKENQAATDVSLASMSLIRRRLYRRVVEQDLSDAVLDDLLPNGQPHRGEEDIWDYKYHFTDSVDPRKIDQSYVSIVKDVAAFHNSYGGYIVFGVSDNPRAVVGLKISIDIDQLNKKITSYTKTRIVCSYRECRVGGALVGILLIPQRLNADLPVEFRKSAVLVGEVRYFQAGDIYIRSGSECRPAKGAEDYAFLFSPRRRRIVDSTDALKATLLDNNIPERDPEFVQFVGRQEYLDELWSWLRDRYNGVKLLAGLGGVGKTTIAHEFASQIIDDAPAGFEKLIWLSAKTRYYLPSRGVDQKIGVVDFVDVRSMLFALASELGVLNDDLDDDATTEDLMEFCIAALETFPSLIVVDDVDSLELSDQYDLFHAVINLIASSRRGAVSSRALITARLDLGAGAGQLIRVSGLRMGEFCQYVRMMSDRLILPFHYKNDSPLMKRFHSVTDGSPLFAVSILRLLSLGEKLDAALSRYAGSDGEDVRRFAFAKEIENLTERQLRTLYACICLKDTSATELENVTESPANNVRDDIAELRKYHLLSLDSDAPKGGPRLVVARGISLMQSIIVDKLLDPRRIESQCRKVRQTAPASSAQVGQYIHRVSAFWHADQVDDALEVAIFATNKIPDSPDLWCLRGRAYLRADLANAKQAELAFRKAHQLRCRRPELFPLWIEARNILQDWVGVVDLTNQYERTIGRRSENIFQRCQARMYLANLALSGGNLIDAASKFKEIGKDIDDAFSENCAHGRVEDLKQMRIDAFLEYIKAKVAYHTRSDEYIEIWIACYTAFECWVRRSDVIHLGLKSLREWWGAVEGRERRDLKAEAALERAVVEIKNIRYVLDGGDWPPRLLDDLMVTQISLEKKLSAEGAE